VPEKAVVPNLIKAEAGIYALVLSSTTTASIRIGKLGDMRLQQGFYVYVGSAHGPGGLSARLAHHLQPFSRPHWHIDYLRAHTKPEEVWYCSGLRSWEHEWARHLGMLRGALIPLVRFGASDCACDSHLYFLERRPSQNAFARRLREFVPEHPPVRLAPAT
jgi:Uri superfamily endonuclease